MTQVFISTNFNLLHNIVPTPSWKTQSCPHIDDSFTIFFLLRLSPNPLHTLTSTTSSHVCANFPYHNNGFKAPEIARRKRCEMRASKEWMEVHKRITSVIDAMGRFLFSFDISFLTQKRLFYKIGAIIAEFLSTFLPRGWQKCE